MKKKLLSLALALALSLSLAVPAFAAEEDKTGTTAPTESSGEEKKDEAPAEDGEKKDETPAEDGEKKDKAPAIDWAVAGGITLGTTETTFGPGNTCSISNILTFLWRANGKPGAAEGVSDRDSAAKWAVEQKLIAEGEDVSAPCTRVMAVGFMWSVAGKPEVEAELSFTDVDKDADYAGAVAWAVDPRQHLHPGPDCDLPVPCRQRRRPRGEGRARREGRVRRVSPLPHSKRNKSALP